MFAWLIITFRNTSFLIKNIIQPSHHNNHTHIHTKRESTVGKMMDWMGDNAKQINTLEAETHFKTKFPILLRDERVEIVFQSGRDFTIFTNVRMLRVDVKGISGKRVEFLTIPYGSIDAFAVQTAGKYLDRDTELKYVYSCHLSVYQYISIPIFHPSVFPNFDRSCSIRFYPPVTNVFYFLLLYLRLFYQPKIKL